MSSTNVSEVLFDIYSTKGLSFSLDIATKLLTAEQSKTKFDMEDRNKVSGDICESVLELCLLEYCRLNPNLTKGWFYTKSLVIPDIDNMRSYYLTEIDFVLFTSSTTVLFECKSYRGDKRITGNGTICRDGQKDFDVFKQHSGHVETFSKMFSGFKYERAQLKSCYKVAVFIFAPGTMTDIRPDSTKKVMPFLEPPQILDYFAQIPQGNNWQLEYVKKAVDSIEKNSDNLRSRHLSYVRGLRHNRDS